MWGVVTICGEKDDVKRRTGAGTLHLSIKFRIEIEVISYCMKPSFDGVFIF